LGSVAHLEFFALIEDVGWFWDTGDVSSDCKTRGNVFDIDSNVTASNQVIKYGFSFEFVCDSYLYVSGEYENHKVRCINHIFGQN
jgi:hypothetical protein